MTDTTIKEKIVYKVGDLVDMGTKIYKITRADLAGAHLGRNRYYGKIVFDEFGRKYTGKMVPTQLYPEWNTPNSYVSREKIQERISRWENVMKELELEV